MGSLIEELKRDGSLVLWHRYNIGSRLDRSGQGNDGTLSAGCFWDGGGLSFAANTDEVTVADVAGLRLTTGSIVVAGEFMSQTATEYLLAHDNAGSGYSLGLNATQLLFTGDGVARTIAATLTGCRSLGATFETGNTPIGYTNGLSIGNFSGSVTVTGASVATEIGNWANSGRCKSALHQAILVNRILTPTEMATLHGELMELS